MFVQLSLPRLLSSPASVTCTPNSVGLTEVLVRPSLPASRCLMVETRQSESTEYPWAGEKTQKINDNVLRPQKVYAW